MIDWLLASIDPTRPHAITVIEAYHARLMFAAWVILIPLGIFIARFFKVTPSQDYPRQLDNPFWWRSHLWLQSLGAAFTAVALGLMFMDLKLDVRFERLHHWLGWTVVLLVAVQILSGIFRGSKGGPTAPAPDGSLRGDHFDMTRYRLAFEYFHKGVGYMLLLIANLTVLTGFWQTNAPRWMWIAFVLWWIAFIVGSVWCQHKRWAVDTYQAIWGHDPTLPGNQIKPIGWGLSRWSEKRNKFN